jgi:hypothetical protein
MNQIEIEKICKDNGTLKSAVTLCAFSNGSIFINGNLIDLKSQAEIEGSEFYLIKGEIIQPATDNTDTIKTKKNESKD